MELGEASLKRVLLNEQYIPGEKVARCCVRRGPRRPSPLRFCEVEEFQLKGFEVVVIFPQAVSEVSEIRLGEDGSPGQML